MKVLVHYSADGRTAYGLWWVDKRSDLQSLYDEAGTPEEYRGRVLVRSKTEAALSWGEWFDRMTQRVPYFEQWRTYDSNGFTPEEMLRSLETANPKPILSA